MISRFIFYTRGERGIRTPGPVTVNSFQDYRNRPLCHLSLNSGSTVVFSGANIESFLLLTKYFLNKI
jgi:hypothetical protein